MLKPLHKNVILKKEKEEKETTTASGIILTEYGKNKPSYAVVVAIGPACKADVQVNDKVVYKENSGTNVTLDDVVYFILEDDDYLAVLA